MKKAHNEWIEQQRTGEGYQTRVAVTLALVKKILPVTSKRNPKGAPKEKWRCSFYPDFCNILGHKDAHDKQYGMKGKSKEEKGATKKVILGKALSEEMYKLTENGKDLCDIIKETFFFNLV